MDVSTILTQARTLWAIDSTQADDSTMTVWLNFVYKRLCSKIKAINENYFYGVYFFDSVPYQNQYEFVLPTASVVGTQKVLNVSVKYQWDTYTAWAASTAYALGDKVTYNGYSYVCSTAHTSSGSFDSTKRTRVYEWYTDAREIDYSNNVYQYEGNRSDPFIDKYWSYYRGTAPSFVLTSSNASWSSVGNKLVLNIFPSIETVIKDAIKVDHIKSIIDLTSSTVEADILIERDYHEVLVAWLLPYIFQAKLMNSEKQLASQEYKDMEYEMLNAMSDRVQSPTTIQNPNLSLLE